MPQHKSAGYTRDARMSDFPGKLQDLDSHSTDLETLVVGVLKFVQAQTMTVELRETTFVTRLHARFVGKRFDPALIPSILALAKELKLFEDDDPFHD